MDKSHYDLIVIGSGPAGEKGAAQAAYFGKKVAIIEKSSSVGGTMANHAVPGKGLRETSLFVNTYTKRNLNGLHLDIVSNPTVSDILHKSDNIRNHMSNWVKANLEKHNVDIFQGTASFQDAKTIDITNINGVKTNISGDYVLIATGSKAAQPSIFPFEAGNVYHSDNIFTMTEIPKSIVVVGGGAIGCEYACIFNHLNVDVTVVNSTAGLFSFADQEIVGLLKESMSAAGITFYMSSSVKSVTSDGKTAVVKTDQDQLIYTDAVFVAAGRRSNVNGLNLSNVHLETTDRNLLKVNESFQTVQPHIYAAGDVIGFPSLSSTAMEQARAAVCHAFNFSYKKGIASLLPFGIWTMPEISMVGLTEESLSEKNVSFVTGKARYHDNARGMAIGEQYGLLKLIFSVPEERLLGVHIIGENACELISPGLIAMTAEATCSTFIDTCFNFPSLSEMYKYATYDAMDKLNKIKSDL